MTATVTLTHNRVALALHHLRDGSDPAVRPLLAVHGLGERTPEAAPAWLDPWPGPVWGLDLTGHGASDPSVGGGYTAEILLADVDTALRHLGPSTLVGRGLGAYVALLAAGARADLVRGAILLDGPGLAGGGPFPGSPMMLAGVRLPPGPPDPYALVELTRDVRPPDYAASFVHQAVHLSGLDTPLTVSTVVRPPWLAAVAGAPGVAEAPLAEALAAYA
ncbi:alpha/beta fold hydrolase [Iamia majanohamensis]|uniref:Alpha/beta fold hydrolase n=1 Tax=Iamia majanohamensis TaxID=467976 RepID=A0AAE9Y542_9ACTN|nr:alpha/beta hydrolase [Iamia majanohamensis]WCO66830.1 alpha/beta fold hydrolase [Iamia majanohamensis]